MDAALCAQHSAKVTDGCGRVRPCAHSGRPMRAGLGAARRAGRPGQLRGSYERLRQTWLNCRRRF
ncbi:UNVERIFIED_CONTAM: hypothetical protein Sradi_3010200 [Sesamum radiatum]|uniref:Uncharacterized protein n=1 Tax=Sesamum radiatum TaxID=300843 RepID=A0AAW2S162_SESRA